MCWRGGGAVDDGEVGVLKEEDVDNDVVDMGGDDRENMMMVRMMTRTRTEMMTRTRTRVMTKSRQHIQRWLTLDPCGNSGAQGHPPLS